MLSVLCLILVSVYLYRHHLYNKLDRQKLSHSSYYDVSFGGERKCSDEVVRILKDVGGYKKIVVNWHYCENGEPSCADVILLHEIWSMGNMTSMSGPRLPMPFFLWKKSETH